MSITFEMTGFGDFKRQDFMKQEWIINYTGASLKKINNSKENSSFSECNVIGSKF